MKYLLLPVIALGMGTAAFAADYPPCSKSVQDECTSTGASHAAMSHKAAHQHHAALHHHGKGKMEKSAKS